MDLMTAFALDPSQPSPLAPQQTPRPIRPELLEDLETFLEPYKATADQLAMRIDLLQVVAAGDPDETMQTWGPDTRWVAAAVQHIIHLLYYMKGLQMAGQDIGLDPHNLSRYQRRNLFDLLLQLHGAGASLTEAGVPDEYVP